MVYQHHDWLLKKAEDVDGHSDDIEEQVTGFWKYKLVLSYVLGENLLLLHCTHLCFFK